MPRIRSIKPEFPADEALAGCSVEARYLFVMLICQVDDEGRMRGAAGLIRGLVFPYDEFTLDDVDGLLVELEALRKVSRYVVDGETFLVIPNFVKHQYIPKPSESKLPAPTAGIPLGKPETQPLPESYGRTTVGLPEASEPRARFGSGSGSGSTVKVKNNDKIKPTSISNEKTAIQKPDIDSVFAAWLDSTGRRGTLDDKRRRLIRNALTTHSLDDVLAAVTGWKHSAYHRGENTTGTIYNDLSLLLRDTAHIERFRDYATTTLLNGNGTPNKIDAALQLAHHLQTQGR